MIISSEHLTQIPFHDARILVVEIKLHEKGCCEVLINVDIDSEESLVAFRRHEIQTDKVSLIFQNCWEATFDLLAFTSQREWIDRLDIVEESELKQKLRSFNVGRSNLIHFRIQGSAGSQLNFVAESFAIVERKEE
jgi:hypothetical protein